MILKVVCFFSVVVSPLSDSEAITITVSEVNEAPVLDPIGNQSTFAGDELSFTVSATDPDLPSQDVTLSVTGLPPGATFETTPGNPSQGGRLLQSSE